MSTEIITADQVKPGDKITITYTDDDGTTIVFTGKVRASKYGGNVIGDMGYIIDGPTEIERHAPEWQSARVVHVAGRTFNQRDTDSAPWIELVEPGGEWEWASHDDLAALGTPRIIIDKDGNPT